MSHLKKSPVGS